MAKNPSRQVKTIQTHVGVRLHGVVSNAIDTEKNRVEMETGPMGVYIEQKTPNGTHEVIIPWSNIQQIWLAPEAKEDRQG